MTSLSVRVSAQRAEFARCGCARGFEPYARGAQRHCRHTGRRKASTPEGRIIHFADRIAYINHDIDDAVRAGIIRENDIPQHLRKRLGETHGKRIDTLVTAMIEYGQRYLEIGMDEQMHADMMELRRSCSIMCTTARLHSARKNAQIHAAQFV